MDDTTSQLTSVIGLINEPKRHNTVKEFIHNSQFDDLFEKNEDGSNSNSLLHWICYNNQVDLLQSFFTINIPIDQPFPKYPQLNLFLIKNGLLNATPLHWACRQGAVDIIMFLIKWVDQECTFEDQNAILFALFNILDTQGFTPLTCAVLSKHDLLAFTIVASCNQFDLLTMLDKDGHSVFHWMGYHGIYNMLIPFANQHNLDFNTTLALQDAQGFTPLHWAACKGHYYTVLQPFLNLLKLKMSPIEIHYILELKNEENYSVYDYAKMHDKVAWINCQLYPKSRYWSFLFSIATLSVIVFGVLLPWYAYILLTPITIFLSVNIVQYLYAGEKSTTILQQGVYLSGLVLSTSIIGLILCINALSYGLHPLTIIFAILTLSSLSLMILSFFKTWVKIPNIPLLIDELHIRNLLITLNSKHMLNKQNICTSCVARKPIRSKHCKELNKCVAKFDHYCPWTSSVIGHHNHHWFYVFVTTLLSSIFLFLIFGVFYLNEIADMEDSNMRTCTDNGTNIFIVAICNGFLFHPIYATFMGWLCINGLWSIFVWGSQTALIFWNMTTNEQVNKHRFAYLNHTDELDEDKRTDSDIELKHVKHAQDYLASNVVYVP